jgi:hypothetical protein
MADEYTTIGDDGAWCWFQDPRAVRHVGDHDRTYTGWVSHGGDIVVASYDHPSGAVTETTLHPEFQEDDHDAPTFYVDEEDRLLVFYTIHGGPDIHYRRSEDPESVASFGPERTIDPSGGYTYPDPRQIGDRLYLFYRNENGSVACVASDDDGRSWGDERELVTTDGRDWCVYSKISEVRDGAVDLGLTFAEAGGHHPHRSIRHARFDGDVLRTAEGAVVGDGESATFWDAPLVYDSDATGNDAWIWDCSVAGGVPQLVYAVFESTDDHAYRYARWTGDEWLDVPVADGGSYITEGNLEKYYSGGIFLDHDRDGVCYYSVGDHGGSTIVRADTDDGGDTWRKTELSGEGVQNVRPVVPWNRHDDLPALWMRGSYTNYANEEYDTAIVGPGVDGS